MLNTSPLLIPAPAALDGTDDRLIVKITVRQSDARGQMFLEPQISLEGWTTSLKPDVADNAAVITLYRDHATSGQFHRMPELFAKLGTSPSHEDIVDMNRSLNPLV